MVRYFSPRSGRQHKATGVNPWTGKHHSSLAREAGDSQFSITRFAG
jgi:hypothetical protein